MPRTGYCWFQVVTEFFLVLCRDKNNCVMARFQILSHKNCHNMAFFFAIGVLILYRNMARCCDIGFHVATEMVTTRGQCCDRSLVKAKRFQIAIENCSVSKGFMEWCCDKVSVTALSRGSH